MPEFNRGGIPDRAVGKFDLLNLIERANEITFDEQLIGGAVDREQKPKIRGCMKPDVPWCDRVIQ